jgi:hypothetical protein
MRNFVTTGVLLVGLLLMISAGTAAHAQQGGGAGAPAGAPAPPSAGLAGDPDQLAGEWIGKYVCRQGVTGLHLKIGRAQASGYALVHFFPLPENPKTAEGCFISDVVFDPASGALDLRHKSWVMRPPRYLMIDFHGKIDPAGQTMTGSLAGAPNCSLFYLARGPSTRPLPDACMPH